MAQLSGGRVSGSMLMLDGLRIPLPKRVNAVVREEQALVLGLRPEAVSLAGRHDLPPGIQLKGEIEIIEPDFSHHIQLLQLRTGQLNYPCQCPIDAQLKVGDTIPVRIDPERLYFFDQESGLAL